MKLLNYELLSIYLSNWINHERQHQERIHIRWNNWINYHRLLPYCKIALYVSSISFSRFSTFWVMGVLFWYHVFCLVRDDALWDSAGADKSCPLYHNFPHIKQFFFEIFFWSSKRRLSIANDNDFVPKNISCNFLLSFTLVDQSNKKRTPASKWSFFSLAHLSSYIFCNLWNS